MTVRHIKENNISKDKPEVEILFSFMWREWGDGVREPIRLVSYQEWKRLDRALELILRWKPDFKPAYGEPGSIYAELENMGLWDAFWETEKALEAKP